MPRPRKSLICAQDTLYYHCVSRCVRRAFLCGEDALTGESYEHRRQWVEDRLHKLSSVFALDVCAYAVMSNHTHVVLHINQQKAASWTVLEVIERWHTLFRGTIFTRDYVVESKRPSMQKAHIRAVEETASVWRKRLCDISWFMRTLNEYIARKANEEDNCTGRFWEGRFKSQALLDEAALMACMAYVDLNPVRAKMAPTPERSNHTSIQYRINAARVGKSPKRLMPFTGNSDSQPDFGLPFQLTDYLRVVDTTARHFQHNKRGYIEKELPDILDRLNLASEHWVELVTSFESLFSSAAGSEAYLIQYQCRHKLGHIKGQCHARRVYRSA